MANAIPLDAHQTELLNLVKVSHANLLLARQVRAAEAGRRRKVAKIEVERILESKLAQIDVDLENEMAAHASAEDEALIAAFEAGIPQRRIALDGFGNQYDGAVVQKLVKLREDGRIGNKIGYQRNNRAPEDSAQVVFPEPFDIDTELAEAQQIPDIDFQYAGIYEAADGSEVDSVNVIIDKRDPWIRAAHQFKAFGATDSLVVTIFLNPYRDELVAVDETLDPDKKWNNVAAYWVAKHPTEARTAYNAAIASVVNK